MNTRPIGIIDIGDDGAKDIKNRLNTENFVAVCLDPIFDQEKSVLENVVHSACQKLIEKNAKIILCLDPFLTQFLPEKQDIPIIGCVVAAVQQACSSSNNKIGVLSSPYALKTGCYGRAVRNIRPTVTVAGGYIEPDNSDLLQSIKKGIDIFIKEKVDCVIIGATIPSKLISEISELMDPMVTLIEQNYAVVQTVKTILLETDMLNDCTNSTIEYIKEL